MPEQPRTDNDIATSETEATPDDRRRILRKLGRFAAITPPAIALLLATASKPNKAQAASIL